MSTQTRCQEIGKATLRTDVGYATTACAPIIKNRYQERCHSIDEVIALLQKFKADGAQEVLISDGYHAFAFNARYQGVPNFDRSRTVILHPVKNHPDHDGIVRETSGSLEPLVGDL